MLSNATPPHGYLDIINLSVRTTKPLSKKKCKDAAMWVTTFEKPAGANGFSKKTEAKYTGEWYDTGGFCDFGMNAPPLPSDRVDSAGTEVWRIAVRAAAGGESIGVTARIGFIFKVPG